MATLETIYPAKGGLVWGQMRGCYLKSGGLHPLGGLYNILVSMVMMTLCREDEQRDADSDASSGQVRAAPPVGEAARPAGLQPRVSTD